MSLALDSGNLRAGLNGTGWDFIVLCQCQHGLSTPSITHTTLNLPERYVGRLGRGAVSRPVFSPDEKRQGLAGSPLRIHRVDRSAAVEYTPAYIGICPHILVSDQGGNTLNPTEVAQLVVAVASESLAEDIVMLDLRQIASFADYFVVMTAQSSRQVESLEEDISQDLKEAGISRFHREGSPGSGWVLLDFSNVIVHIFGPEEREYFALERLWARAPQVVRVQ